MKHCLLYTSCLQKGGTERIVCVYAKYFQAKGCDTTVLTNFRLEQEYTLPAGIRRLVVGEKIHETVSRIHNYLERLRAIRKICKENQVETAIAFAKANAVRLVLATIGLKTKVIISIRTNPEAEFQPGLMSGIVMKLFSLADGFLFQTNMQRDFFGTRIAKRAIVVPNSIDKSFMREAYKGKRDNRIVTMGRLIPCKNHKLLMKSFSRVVREFPELELVIYGEGSYREELEQERARLGLEDKIRLPGAVDCVADAVQSARLFVLSSDYEGMPNALLEAMALGIPVISTDCPCGGPAEIIRNGENGLLVETGKEEELSAAMLMLLRDDELRKRIGNNGRQVQQDYSEEQTFEKLYEYLEKVIAE